MKVRPYYDRSELIALTTRTVEENLLRGIVLVLVVLMFFLYDGRSGLIVATTIPLSLLFAFICLDLRHVPANLLSIGAIDFGIIVDGAVVMVENIFRQLSLRRDDGTSVREIVMAAASEVDRPILYAIAVIIAGFLPIYVLSGPSGTLFRPMADTTIFALIGSLILTLTLLPVLCFWVLGARARERHNPGVRVAQGALARGLDWSLRYPWRVIGGSVGAARRLARADPGDRRRVHAEARRGRALGAVDDAVHDLLRGIVAHRARRSAPFCAPSRR